MQVQVAVGAGREGPAAGAAKEADRPLLPGQRQPGSGRVAQLPPPDLRAPPPGVRGPYGRPGPLAPDVYLPVIGRVPHAGGRPQPG